MNSTIPETDRTMPRHQLPETATTHSLDPEQARRLLEQSAVRELIRVETVGCRGFRELVPGHGAACGW